MRLGRCKTTNFNTKETENLISTLVSEFFASEKEYLCFVNIGTDKCIGDCLGPLVGTLLETENISNVYGTLQKPIHALNLDIAIPDILNANPDAFVIGIDACLGSSGDTIGEILLRDIPIRPGKGVGKELTEVGDLSIIGIVELSDNIAVGNFVQYPFRLGSILEVAQHIVYIIKNAVSRIDSMRLEETDVIFKEEC